MDQLTVEDFCELIMDYDLNSPEAAELLTEVGEEVAALVAAVPPTEDEGRALQMIKILEVLWGIGCPFVRGSPPWIAELNARMEVTDEPTRKRAILIFINGGKLGNQHILRLINAYTSFHVVLFRLLAVTAAVGGG
jgi:hypothetical protein